EGPHRAVGVAEGLQALEDLLAVVQHRRGGRELQRAEGEHLSPAPAALDGPSGVSHEVRVALAEAGSGEDPSALVVADTAGGAGLGEVERTHGVLLGAGWMVRWSVAGAQRPAIAATRSSPICVVPRAPSASEPARAARSFSTAARTAAAGSRWPR